MKTTELLRKLRNVARQRGVEMGVRTAKGSHQKISFGNRSTIIAAHGRDMPTGTLRKILKDLGIREEEL